MSSKKLYEEVATVLSDLSLAPPDHATLVAALSSVFERGNSRFDAEKFAEAAKPKNARVVVDAETLSRLIADYIAAAFDEAAAESTSRRPSIDSVVEVAREIIVRRYSEESP